MGTFTNSEYDRMVEEVISRGQYDTLAEIVQEQLLGYITRCVSGDRVLRGTGREDDIMQEIQIKVIKTVVTGFLMRDGEDGPINRDADGFRKWLTRVGQTTFLDHKKAYCRRMGAVLDPDDRMITEIPDPEEERTERNEENTERLLRCLEIILDSDQGIYKILTWLAEWVFILRHGMTRARIPQKICDTFADKTLEEMFGMIEREAGSIRWLRFSDEQRKKILDSLETEKNGRRLADVRYRELYMSKGASQSVSDWINRINRYVCDHWKY